MARFVGWMKKEDAIKGLWNSRKIGVSLWIAFGILTLYWRFCVPPPGYAIGALAVVAGIMSVREMSTLAKVSWVVLLICLLLTEFTAIDKDRADNQEQQRKFFEAQKKGFQGIATQAQSNFATTTGGLKAAIEGLDANIKVATQTFQQTRPHADVRLLEYELDGDPLIPFKAKSIHQFLFYFNNPGTESARIYKKFGGMYIGKPNASDAEKAISRAFETDWDKSPAAPRSQFMPTVISLAPLAPFWATEGVSFTENDVARLNKGETLYLVRRIEYSDSLGRWYTDVCGYMEPRSFDHPDQRIANHPCSVLVNPRYAVPRARWTKTQ